jgi:hypothetical protein
LSTIGVLSATAGIQSEWTPGELLGRIAPNVLASRYHDSIRPPSSPNPLSRIDRSNPRVSPARITSTSSIVRWIFLAFPRQ